MTYIVSITSQGQLTIPAAVRQELGINAPIKASLQVRNGQLVVEPKLGFWSLAGRLAGQIKLSDKQLRQARDQFSEEWADDETAD